MSKLGTRYIASALLLPSIAAGSMAPAMAQEAPEAIAVEQQPLADALREIAAQSGVDIRFDEDLVVGITSQPVRASSVRAAIAQAIGTTPLAFSGNDADGYLVAERASADSGEILVRARLDEAEQRYLVEETASSTRDGRSLRDQPQSTTVISSRLLADQQVQTVAEALRNASGTTVNLGNVQGLPSFTVRGFFVQPLNGGLTDPGALAQPVANIERIEVLKGPTAILAGANSEGGTVNVVSKRPTSDDILTAVAEYGSYEDIRVGLDGSAAISPDRRFSSRLVLQYAKADRNAAGYDGRIDHLIAPTIRFKDRNADVVLGIDFSDQRLPAPAFGIFNFQGDLVSLADGPRGPAEQGFRTQNRRFYYDASLRAADWLTLVSRSHYSLTDTRLRIYALAQTLAPNFDLVLKTDEEQFNSTFATDNYARFQFATGPVEHTLSAGFNYSNTDRETFRSPTSSVFLGNYLGNSFPFTPFARALVFGFTNTSEQRGYFAQNFMELGRLSVLAAVRHNEFVSISRVASVIRNEVSTTTPQFGAVFDVTDEIAIYANYQQGFAPQFLTGVDGVLLPPRETRNLEAGVKWDLANDRLALTVSGFRLRETNSPIPVTGQRGVFEVIAGQESQGVEIDLVGQIMPGLSVAGSYSYATYDLLEVNPSIRFVAGQPNHRYSAFARYEVQDGPLESLAVAVNFNGFSSSFADPRDEFVLPAQSSLGLNAYYQAGPVGINLGVSNVLDDEVYGITRTRTYVPLNPERTFRLTLTYRGI